MPGSELHRINSKFKLNILISVLDLRQSRALLWRRKVNLIDCNFACFSLKKVHKMPTLMIETNLKKEQIPESFCSEATTFIAEALGKPASYVLIQINPNQLMTFGGTDEPCANVTLNCIGVVGPEWNRKNAPKLSEMISQKLGIKENRFYINIYDIQRPACVWDGKTFG